MEPNDIFFSLKPFKEIRKLFNAMMGGNWVTVTYRTDSGNKMYEGYVAGVGNDGYILSEDISTESTLTWNQLGYTNLMKITTSYVVRHGNSTVISALSTKEDKMLHRLFDDMLAEECVDIYLRNGTILDTNSIFMVFFNHIELNGNHEQIPLKDIVLVTQCQKYSIE